MFEPSCILQGKEYGQLLDEFPEIWPVADAGRGVLEPKNRVEPIANSAAVPQRMVFDTSE